MPILLIQWQISTQIPRFILLTHLRRMQGYETQWGV